jgi:tetratricopeptide (TPR) repeat protein
MLLDSPLGSEQGVRADACAPPSRWYTSRGATMSGDDRIERARLLYERAVFNGDAGALTVAERELDAVEADLTLARGRVLHGRFLDERNEDPRELVLFERAAQLYRVLGDVRGESEALFWIGLFHQVVHHDNDAAVPVLERSRELAAQIDDKLTLSYALRHLGVAEHGAGRLDTARERLEESVRLRREIGFLPGVAANLVGLIYLAAALGRPDDAMALADEAGAIAEATGARSILRQVQEARAAL